MIIDVAVCNSSAAKYELYTFFKHALKGLVGWGLTALLTQFRSYRAFEVKTIL